MKPRSLLLTLALLATPAVSHAADRARQFAGSNCRPVYYSQYASALYGRTFMQPTGARMDVFCPITVDSYSDGLPWSNINLADVRVIYSDGSATAGATGDLYCDLEAIGSNGSLTWSGTKYACSTWGGCPDSTNGIFVDGTLQFGFPYNPIINTNFSGGLLAAGVHCSLPASQTYWSEIREYSADVTYSW